MATHGRQSHVVIFIFILGGATLLSGCSVATPLCDQASVLLGQGQLAQGTALYARALEQGEGDCAEAGLTAAAEQYGRAATEEARGATAEQAGDLAAATTAYRSALTQDAGNPLAAAGLVRLGEGAVPPPQNVTILPVPAPSPIVSWWATQWPYTIGSALFTILLISVSFLRLRRSHRAQRLAILERLRSERERHERQLDRLVGVIADRRPDVAAEKERYFEQPGAPKKHQPAAADSIRLIDIRIFATVTPDGRHHLVVQRIRWSPADPRHAEFSQLAQAESYDPAMLARALADDAVDPAWEHDRKIWVIPADRGFTPVAGAIEDLQRQYHDLVHGLSIRAATPGTGLAPASPALNHDGFASLKRLVRFTGVVVGPVADPTITHACLTTLVSDVASERAALHLEEAAGITPSPGRTTAVEVAASSAAAQVARIAQ